MNDAVIPATYRRLKTLADGTVQLVVEVEPKDAATAFSLFQEPHIPIAIARLAFGESAGAAIMPEGGSPCPPRPEKAAESTSEPRVGPHGDWWRRLFEAGVFQAPPVLRALGSDDAYLDWIRDQRCQHCGNEPRWEMSRWVRNEAAHVRRVANGSGTAEKPPHSAITLCTRCHGLQHQQGESALGGKDWVARKLVQQRNAWAKERLHSAFDVGSLTHIEPQQAVAWFESRELLRYLPEGSRVPAVLQRRGSEEESYAIGE